MGFKLANDFDVNEQTGTAGAKFRSVGTMVSTVTAHEQVVQIGVNGGDLASSGPVSVANPFPVSGSVGISGTAAVSIASPVDVNGAVAISGTAAVSIASPVSVNGSVGISGTAAVSIASPVSVNGSVGISGTAVVSSSNIDLTGSAQSVLSAIRDSVELMDNAVTGSSIAVTIVGGSSSGTEYSSDAASTGNATGTLSLGRRRDADTSPVSTDDDWHPMVFDDVGNLKVATKRLNGIADTGNSTTAALSANQGYTGTGVDVLYHTHVVITLMADQDSATDGMQFQFSTDNSNWDDVYTFTMSANDTRRFIFPVTARYFRFVYNNGASGQGSFRAATLLQSSSTQHSVHRLQDDVSPDRSCSLQKTALMARVNGTGDFKSIQSNSAGILKIGGSVDVDSIPNVNISATAAVSIASPVDVNGAVAISGSALTALTTIENSFARTNVVHRHGTVSTSSAVLVTAAGASTFNDITSLVVVNQAGSNNIVRLATSSTADPIYTFNLAASGGGAVMTFTTPIPQSGANKPIIASTESGKTANFAVTCIQRT